MPSRNSSKADSTNSQETIEQFSIKKHGSTITIVFLIIALGALGYFLWECKKNAKAVSA
jgi:hypothetical protein